MIKKEFRSYFEKLNIKPENLSLELVSNIQKQHLQNYSFNNLSVLLGEDISLDISDIINKIVIKGFGGYCFEHNKLMHDVLKSLGFNVRLLVGRVINNQDIDAPRTHRITLLEWQDDHYLIDVGFGPKNPQKPVKIEIFNDSNENNQSYRITQDRHQDFRLEMLTQDGYYALYTFNLNRYTEADCLVGNFYSHKHPNAVFVNNLIVSLIYPDVILSLINDTYHRIGTDNTDIIEIKDHRHLKSIVDKDFNIKLSGAECELIFQKATQNQS